jgi:hypothetical protein
VLGRGAAPGRAWQPGSPPKRSGAPAAPRQPVSQSAREPRVRGCPRGRPHTRAPNAPRSHIPFQEALALDGGSDGGEGGLDDEGDLDDYINALDAETS